MCHWMRPLIHVNIDTSIGVFGYVFFEAAYDVYNNVMYHLMHFIINLR